MFDLILDLGEEFDTVEERRLQRIFGGLEFGFQILYSCLILILSKTDKPFYLGHRMWPSGKAARIYNNGYTKKTVKTQLGEVDIKFPRDRNGSFEPKIIGKYDRNADGMEDKILALYACGMSQRDIAEQIRDLYGVEISP